MYPQKSHPRSYELFIVFGNSVSRSTTLFIVRSQVYQTILFHTLFTITHSPCHEGRDKALAYAKHSFIAVGC